MHLLTNHAVAAMLVAATVEAQAVPETNAGPIGRRMHEYLTRATTLGFTGQVLVARGGTVLLHQAYGFADRAAALPLSDTTRVGVASMSKQFTAAAVLKLAGEGKLKLTDSLGTFFDSVPADKRGITLQHLLTHTSHIWAGVADDFDVPTLEESISRLLTKPLNGKIGGPWRYASDGYGLLAAVVQRVARMPFEQYMHTALFAPAGMMHTGFWSEARATTQPIAKAYTGWNDRGSPREWPRNWRVFGSGDMLTTAADLYRWHLALSAGKVLPPNVVERYMTPQVQIGEGPDWYAYGLFVETSDRKTRVVEHGGDTELGYNGAFFRYPDENAVLIITSNAQDAYGRSFRGYVQRDLEAMLFGSDSIALPPDLHPLNQRVRASLAGSYQTSDGAFHLIDDGVTLWLAADGQTAVDLVRASAPEETPLMYARAIARTDSLLSALLAHDPGVYRIALGDSGAAYVGDYTEEWSELLSRFGQLHHFRVMGAVRTRAALTVYTRLSFLRADRTMTFQWSDLGRGRLSGSDAARPGPFPVVLAIGRAPDGALIVHDLWRQTQRARLRIDEAGRLRVQRIEGNSASGHDLTTKARSTALLRPS